MVGGFPHSIRQASRQTHPVFLRDAAAHPTTPHPRDSCPSHPLLPAIGFDTLVVSIVAPPTSHAEALAAGHFTFCPGNVTQGGPNSIAAYAKHLIGQPTWALWWD